MRKAAIVKTAEDIILEIKELPPEEFQKGEEYLLQTQEEWELSPEEEAEVDRRIAEADRGENLSPTFNSVEDMMNHLRNSIKNED